MVQTTKAVCYVLENSDYSFLNEQYFDDECLNSELPEYRTHDVIISIYISHSLMPGMFASHMKCEKIFKFCY